eukprot:m.1186690 g.1186690  ORF g.1186690 m.1186690 type:complete len:104 (+) comp24548_c0_seq21:5762-6073(+)
MCARKINIRGSDPFNKKYGLCKKVSTGRDPTLLELFELHIAASVNTETFCVKNNILNTCADNVLRHIITCTPILRSLKKVTAHSCSVAYYYFNGSMLNICSQQ